MRICPKDIKGHRIRHPMNQQEMFWSLVLSTILVCSLVSGNGSDVQEITPEDGWVQFSFGRANEPPFNKFHFNIGLMGGDHGDNIDLVQLHNGIDHGSGGRSRHGIRRCYLEVTDAFCPGDRFRVLRLNNTDGTIQEELFATPVVPFNPIIAQEICNGFPVQCANSTSNPNIAFYDPTWSSGAARVSAGNYTVLIKPINSPYCSGGAFIRIRCPERPHPPLPPNPPHPPHPPVPGNICQLTQMGMHMVLTPVQGPAAGAVCTGLGMKLADITNANFGAATQVALGCSGPLSTSWIGSWNEQTWAGQQGLGLTVSTAAPGGSINVYNDGVARNVLCQDMLLT